MSKVPRRDVPCIRVRSSITGLLDFMSQYGLTEFGFEQDARGGEAGEFSFTIFLVPVDEATAASSARRSMEPRR